MNDSALEAVNFEVSIRSEIEQGPMVYAPHVLSLPFVCGKTLAKE